MIDVEVDRLTNSIIEVATGRKLDTLVTQCDANDFESMKGLWQFNWRDESRHWEVYKLVAINRVDEIQGLISLKDAADHVFVNLVENHPQNVGRGKRYEGVAGNLFAYAALVSLEHGYRGYVSFIAKTALIDHYAKTLGAVRVGRSSRMHIEPPAAEMLIANYFGA